MSTFEDVQRRIHFMVNELRRLHHDEKQYHLVISRQLFADLMVDADLAWKAAYHMSPAKLFGFPLRLYDGRMKYYLALVHEVQG